MAAIKTFLTGGSGATIADFNNPAIPITIKINFNHLNTKEKSRWKKYLVGEDLILEKNINATPDEDGEAYKLSAEYHGYTGTPVQTHLSIEKILETHGPRPDWTDIALNAGLPDYFFQDGKSNKTIYTKATDRFIEENEVEFNPPDLSATKALGLQSNVISSLPES